VLSDQFVNLVAERFDVALRVGSLADSALVQTRVGFAPGLVVAAPSYLERAGTPETPRDLGRHNCLRFSNLTAAREWRFRGKKGGAVSVPVIGNLELNHGGALREAAIAGAGIARLPEFLVGDALATGALVTLLDDFRIDPVGIHLVHPTGRPLPKVEVFVKDIAAGLKRRLKVRSES
jgi:DNA-binding transcriptional LysR family regulator